MGAAWAVFMPIINTIVFTVIFTRVARIETTVPYPLFAYCGLLPWNTFATSLKTGVNTLIRNKALLTKVYFPREVFPFSTLLVSVIDFFVGLSILAAMMICYQIALTATVFFLPDSLGPADVHGGPGDVAGARQSVLPGREVHPRRAHRGGDVCHAGRLPDATSAARSGWRFSSIRSRRSSMAIGPFSCGASCRAPPFATAAVFSFCLFAIGWLVFHRAEYAFAENA